MKTTKTSKRLSLVEVADTILPNYEMKFYCSKKTDLKKLTTSNDEKDEEDKERGHNLRF
jgi:hypothetical protein